MTARTLTKAWLFEDGTIQKAQTPSQQLSEDPFTYSNADDSGQGGLQEPPYNLDQLSRMLETNALHARCVKQKGADIVGRGIVLQAKPRGDSQAEASQAEKDRWDAFVESVEDDQRADESFKERLVAAHEDFESVGWGVLEVSRRADGELDGLWHVPGHTVRAHKDSRRYAQIRSGKTVWFKRFGLDGDVDRRRGAWSPTPLPVDVRGNELIVLTNYTPRSSFYGLPDHIPAMHALAGWTAQADFNVRFFERNAVPAYAVIIEGADITPELEETIQEHFKQLKGEPHKTLILPVPGAPGDEASAPKVHFEKLAIDIKDASFRLYKQDNALEVCIAHGMPPYRVGWPIVGSLGGATAEEMTQIYNDAVVQPRQETWESRLNRALLGKRGLALTEWQLKANELDTRNELRDILRSRGLYEMNIATPNTLADFYGLPHRDDPGGDLYRDQLQLMGVGGKPGEIPAFTAEGYSTVVKRWTEEVQGLANLRKQVARLLGEEAAA